jgi:hypothetical protein
MNTRQGGQGWAKTQDLWRYQKGFLWAFVLGLALMLMPDRTLGVPTDDPIEVKRVKSTGVKYKDVLKDTDGQPYITVNGPEEYRWHWLKEGPNSENINHDHSYPALYVSDSTMEAVVKLTRPPNGRALTFDIKGVTSGGNVSITLSSMGNVFAANSTTMEVTVVAQDELAEDTVSFFDKIDWSYNETGSSGSGAGAGSSNKVYVTRHDTGGGVSLFHTTVHVACSKYGATTEAGVVAKTWEHFSTTAGGQTVPANVKTWDGNALYYYKDGVPSSEAKTTLGAMLQDPNRNGECGAFQQLLGDAWLVNGVSDWAKKKVLPAQGTGFFLIGSWSFGTPDAVPVYPYVLVFANGQSDFVPANNVSGTLTSTTGLAGQNSPTPADKVFTKHFINLYGTTYYDPSYGKVYSGEQSFETSVVTGHAIDYTEPGQTHLELRVRGSNSGLGIVSFTTP